MADTETEIQWQTEPTVAGYYWARGLTVNDVIIEAEDGRTTSDSEPKWLIKQHGRVANKDLDELPRKVKFLAIPKPL